MSTASVALEERGVWERRNLTTLIGVRGYEWVAAAAAVAEEEEEEEHAGERA